MTSIVAVDAVEDLTAAQIATRPARPWRDPRALVPAQLAATLAAGAAVAVGTGASLPLASALLGAVTLGVLAAAHESIQAGRLDPQSLVRAASVTLLTMTCLVVLTDLGERALWQATAMVTVTTLVLAAAQLVVRLAPRPLRVMLVGDPRAVGPVLTAWGDRADLSVRGVLLVGPEGLASPGWSVPTSADPATVREVAATWDVETVVVLPGADLDATYVQRLGWALEGSQVRLAVSSAVLESVAHHRLHLTRLQNTVFTCIEPSRPPVLVRLAKGVVDRLVGLLLLVAFGPLLLVLGLAVRLDSSGPALFRQTRVGQDGVPFTMLKLRTMQVDAEDRRADLLDADEGNGVLFKLHQDPRVTRVGRWLRALSLDELPQLVNVVRGEMSLVGPRPALPAEVQAYDERARRRLAVLPGMTGLWQVRGRSCLTWEESVALDLNYTDNISMTRDLAICVETIRAVASRKGAY